MPPEYCDEKEYTSKGDVWGLGVLLYELVSGVKPFDDALMKKVIANKDLWDKSNHRLYDPIPESYSEELSDVIDYMLHPNLEDRPTIDEVMNTKIVRLKMKQLFPDMKTL